MKLRRLRWIFCALAVVLLVPLVFLVRAGLSSVSLERDFRHRIVAERIVDEMERELTSYLAMEEERPYAQYRYYAVRPGGFELEVSPLAAIAAQSFVVGHFQFEPDGSITSPLVPRNSSLAASLSGWTEAPQVAARMAQIEVAVDGLWRQDSDPVPVAADRQAAGSTVELDSRRKQKQNVVAQARSEEKELQSQEAAPFRALEKLKRGASQRQERSAKVESSEASNVYNFSQSVEDNALQDVSLQDQTAPPAAARDQLGAAVEQALRTPADARIDVRQEPMVGRQGEDGRLVLYRTVLVEDQVYRQGVVLDQQRLVDWLSERVLSRPGVAANVALLPGAAGSASAGAADGGTTGFRFRHRFAEPFGSLEAVLTLAPLPEPRAATYLYVLSAIVALASTLGLFGLYRTVAVSLNYAERRNNFVSAVTHELKTPLTAIRMYGEMLRDGLVQGDDKRQRYYQLMTAESERLSRLLNNVLELSALEQKSRAVDLVIGDIAKVIGEVADLLRPHCDNEGFSLHVELEDNLPQARFDRDALKQVLFNLVDNAMKYSATSDRREIVVKCRRDGGAPGRSGLRISVVDRGPGVARQHLQRIFEPFYRPEDELTRQSKGTGIGLALVRGLVEQMGGTVRGLNLEQGGFEVRIELPAAAG